MSRLPMGTVTLLFTDIEGSTRLLHELGDAYGDVLAEHRRALRDAFGRHGGVEVDTQGDAFFYAFARANDAVAAAGEAQQALDEGPVRVRIGVHTGEPTVAAEGYVGVDVHRAARIMSAGHGRQVLLSEATRRLLDSQYELRDLGEHRLKDLASPERIFQLGAGAFPPLKSLNNTNLPLRLEPLLGRKRELAELLRLIRGGGVRLVTVTGPGGIGKTRLALELALEVVGDFEHGVWFVDLSAVSAPDLVEPTVAATLGAKADLIDHIGERDLALVLDNFEQVIGASAAVARLVTRCRNLAVVVTSREPLHIAGEREYALRSLAEAPAVELFRQRAESAGGESGSYQDVAQICTRLDSLPLAIELAAARTKTLALAELRARLEQRLPLLTKGRRDAPERQRTLRATIEWSYGLLSAEDQRLFRRLAVFVGGCTLVAAEEICGADLDSVDSLVDKSLVGHESGRYSMLDTIREYAVEQLDAAGEGAEVRDAHAVYFARIADCRALDLIHGKDPQWRETVALEARDLHAGLEWSLEHGRGEDAMAILSGIWPSPVHAERMKRWLERALELPGERATTRRMLVLVGLAEIAMYQDDHETMKRVNAEIVALARELDEPRRLAMALTALGDVALVEGDNETARRLVEEAIEIRITRAAGFGLARSLASLANIAFVEGDLAEAQELFQKALARTRNDSPLSAHVGEFLAQLGQIAVRRGDMDAALSAFSEALQRGHELGEAWTVAESLEGIAAILAASDDQEAAQRIAGAAVGLRERAGITARLLAGADDPVGDRAAEAWRAGRAMSTDEAVEFTCASIDSLR